MALGCPPDHAAKAVHYYRLIRAAIKQVNVRIYESVKFPHGLPRIFILYREEIEAWLKQQGVLLPERLLASREKTQDLIKQRTTDKQWVDLVNTTDTSRYQATSSPAALKRDKGYYRHKLAGIGLVTYLLLDMPYEQYQGQKTEALLHYEWQKSESTGVYPWMWMVYGALREAVLLDEILPKHITTHEVGVLYEVSLKAALQWCSTEGVILDALMLAYVDKVKNHLPYPDGGLTSRAVGNRKKCHGLDRLCFPL
jgi:hypothetical protein